MTAHRRAAERLIETKDELAASLTAALYADMPHLHDKYGERGRLRCHEDMRFNIEHLAPAVALEQPHMFAAYVRWLDDMLRARSIDTAEVTRSLELMMELVRDRLEPGEADAAAESIHAGLAALETSP